MREYTISFDEGISVGLRRFDKPKKGDKALIQSDGVLKDSGTLTNLEQLGTVDFSALGCTFPFPQIFQLKNFTLVCTPTDIYTYDGSALTLCYTAEAGSTWTIADFYNYIIMTNGKELVTLDPMSGDWSKYIDCAIPNCLCLCELNGQVVVGGPEVSISAGFLG